MGYWNLNPGTGVRTWVPVNPYCTADDVFAELRDVLPAEGADKRNQVLQAIESASRYVDRWRGRDYYFHDHSVTPIEVDEYDSGYTKQAIYLKVSPAIGTVTVNLASIAQTADLDYVLVSKAHQDGTTALQIVPLSRLGTGSRSWNLNRRLGDILTIYGLFGYDQRAIKDSDGNITGYGATGTYSAANVPDVPDVIGMATASIAAAMSGHFKKEFVDLEGQRQTVTSKAIDDVAKEILGAKWGGMLT
jgi:hypothetical protein